MGIEEIRARHEAVDANIPAHLQDLDVAQVHQDRAWLLGHIRVLDAIINNPPPSDPKKLYRYWHKIMQRTDAQADRIEELERQLTEAIKWIQHDCPWDEQTIRTSLSGKVEVSDE